MLKVFAIGALIGGAAGAAGSIAQQSVDRSPGTDWRTVAIYGVGGAVSVGVTWALIWYIEQED